MKQLIEVFAAIGGIAALVGWMLKLIQSQVPEVVDKAVDLAESNPIAKEVIEKDKPQIEGIVDAAAQELHKKLDNGA